MMNLDDHAEEAVRAYVQAGKCGKDLLGAMRCAIEAAVLVEREARAKVCEKAPCERYDAGTAEFRAWNESTIDMAALILARSNAELSGPRPLAAEGSRSNAGLGHATISEKEDD